jgi:hypothetical protein
MVVSKISGLKKSKFSHWYDRIMMFNKYPPNLWVWGISCLLLMVLTLTSFIGYWGIEEEIVQEGTLSYYWGRSFEVFRFPTQNILYLLVEHFPSLMVLYFPGLWFNVFFQATIIGRVVAFARGKYTQRIEE